MEKKETKHMIYLVEQINLELIIFNQYSKLILNCNIFL